MERFLWARLPIKVDHRRKVDATFSHVPTLRCLSTHHLRSRVVPQLCSVGTSNREILELLFTLRRHDPNVVVPRLHKYCIAHHFIDESVQLKPFWKRITDLEKKFLGLRKNHNARCGREGSHSYQQLTSFLDKPFYQKSMPMSLALIETVTLPDVNETSSKQVGNEVEYQRPKPMSSTRQIQQLFDIKRICTKYKSSTALRDALWNHVQFLKSEHREIFQKNQNLFKTSHDGKSLSCDDLKTNLKRIVRLLNVGSEHGRDEDVPLSHMKVQREKESLESDLDFRDDGKDFTFEDASTDKCVCVGFLDRWYPGFVVRVISPESAVVNFMHPVKNDLNCLCFGLPKQKDEMEVSAKDVLYADVNISLQGTSLRLWEVPMNVVLEVTRKFLQQKKS